MTVGQSSHGGASRSRAWLCFAAVFVGVTVLMLVPLGSSGGAPSIPHLDKLVHLGAWLALAVALWFPLRAAGRMSVARAIAMVAGLGLWGVAIELLQGLVPERTGDVWDALADLCGAALGALIMAALERREPQGAAHIGTTRENDT